MTKNAHVIAATLYSWMSKDLVREPGEWIHSPTEFLPANVQCDHAGMMKFINGMAEVISGVEEEEGHD